MTRASHDHNPEDVTSHEALKTKFPDKNCGHKRRPVLRSALKKRSNPQTHGTEPRQIMVMIPRFSRFRRRKGEYIRWPLVDMPKLAVKLLNGLVISKKIVEPWCSGAPPPLWQHDSTLSIEKPFHLGINLKSCRLLRISIFIGLIPFHRGIIRRSIQGHISGFFSIRETEGRFLVPRKIHKIPV